MSNISSLVKTSFTPIALCLGLLASSSIMAGHERHNSQSHIFSQLDLTSTQKQDIKQLKQESRAQSKVYKADKKAFRQTLSGIIHSDQWDQAALESAISQHQVLMQQVAMQAASNKNKIWQLLDPAQQIELNELSAERKTKRQEKSANKDKGRPKNKFKRLDLTDQQKANLKLANSEYSIQAEFVKAQLQSFKQAELELIQSNEFTSDAWLELHNNYKDAFFNRALLKAQMQHQVWLQMTAEQKAKLLSKKERKQPKHNKHRT